MLATRPRRSKLRTDVKLRDLYKLGKTLGTGGTLQCARKCSATGPGHRHGALRAGFSVVKLATDRGTGVEYACKIMALPPVGQEVGENENTR